jgi:hypothetical protein
MTWHTESVEAESLSAMLETVRDVGGMIISCKPQDEVVLVTWTVEG